MEIADLRVSDEFLAIVRSRLITAGDMLMPRDGVDAYGYALSLGLAQVYDEVSTLLRATIRVAIGFEADSWYGNRMPEAPGAIEDIVDFSRVLCFGSSPEG